MAAVQALGEPEDGRERPDGLPPSAPEVAILLVLPLRRRLPVIAGDEGDDFDLFGVESP